MFHMLLSKLFARLPFGDGTILVSFGGVPTANALHFFDAHWKVIGGAVAFAKTFEYISESEKIVG